MEILMYLLFFSFLSPLRTNVFIPLRSLALSNNIAKRMPITSWDKQKFIQFWSWTRVNRSTIRNSRPDHITNELLTTFPFTIICLRPNDVSEWVAIPPSNSQESAWFSLAIRVVSFGINILNGLPEAVAEHTDIRSITCKDFLGCLAFQGPFKSMIKAFHYKLYRITPKHKKSLRIK